MADNLNKKYNEVLEIIDRRLIPDEAAKKARGEVFTPLRLAREMLLGIRKSSINTGKIEIWGIKDDTFIDDDESDRIGGVPLEILRDSESTFLDPSNGIGNFPIVTFYILDYQLNKHGKNKKFRGEENTKKRQEHIVKNMLFMIELNKGNVNTSIKIFKLITNAKPNICCANTLKMTDEKLMSYFGVNRFDVVMGNPPFQEEGKGGDNKLYLLFMKYSNTLLKPKGYILFVVPSSSLEYLKLDKKKDIIDKKYNIIFVNKTDKYLKTFFPNVGSTFVYFLYNDDIYKDTLLLTYINDTFDLQKINFFEDNIVSKIDSEIFKLIFDDKINYPFKDFDFGKGEGRRIRQEHIDNGTIRNIPSNEFKYKIIKTINKGFPWPPENGNFYYFNKKDIHYEKDKIVFSKSGDLMPTLDTTHQWTYSDNFKYILCDNNCKQLEILFKSPLIDYIIKIKKTSGFADNSLFDRLGHIKRINLDKIKDNDDIYKELHIEKYKEHIEFKRARKNTTSKNKKPKGGYISRRLTRKKYL